jgi:hypothetical protein
MLVLSSDLIVPEEVESASRMPIFKNGVFPEILARLNEQPDI